MGELSKACRFLQLLSSCFNKPPLVSVAGPWMDREQAGAFCRYQFEAGPAFRSESGSGLTCLSAVCWLRIKCNLGCISGQQEQGRGHHQSRCQTLFGTESLQLLVLHKFAAQFVFLRVVESFGEVSLFCFEDVTLRPQPLWPTARMYQREESVWAA